MFLFFLSLLLVCFTGSCLSQGSVTLHSHLLHECITFIYCCRFTPELFVLPLFYFLCIYCLSCFTHSKKKALFGHNPIKHSHIVAGFCIAASYRTLSNNLCCGWFGCVSNRDISWYLEAVIDSVLSLEVILFVFTSFARFVTPEGTSKNKHADLYGHSGLLLTQYEQLLYAV